MYIQIRESWLQLQVCLLQMYGCLFSENSSTTACQQVHILIFQPFLKFFGTRQGGRILVCIWNNTFDKFNATRSQPIPLAFRCLKSRISLKIKLFTYCSIRSTIWVQHGKNGFEMLGNGLGVPGFACDLQIYNDLQDNSCLPQQARHQKEMVDLSILS